MLTDSELYRARTSAELKVTNALGGVSLRSPCAGGLSVGGRPNPTRSVFLLSLANQLDGKQLTVRGAELCVLYGPNIINRSVVVCDVIYGEGRDGSARRCVSVDAKGNAHVIPFSDMLLTFPFTLSALRLSGPTRVFPQQTSSPCPYC